MTENGKKVFCLCLTFLTSAKAISSMSFLFSDIFAFERGKPLRAAAAAAAAEADATAAASTDDPSCNNNGSKY